MVNKLLRNFRFSLLQRQLHASRSTMSRLCAPIPPRSCLPRTMNVNVSPTGMSGALSGSRGAPARRCGRWSRRSIDQRNAWSNAWPTSATPWRSSRSGPWHKSRVRGIVGSLRRGRRYRSFLLEVWSVWHNSMEIGLLTDRPPARC